MDLRKLNFFYAPAVSTVIFFVFAASFKCNLILLQFLNHDFTLKVLSLERIPKAFHMAIAVEDHLSTYTILFY